MLLCNLRHPFRQRRARMQIVEADRNPRLGLGRDHIMRAVAHLQIGDFEIGRLEPVGPFVEHQRIQLRQYRDQFRDRVIGEMRISDMALRALYLDPDIDRAAPPDLHHIAQPVDAGGFPDKAHIWLLATFAHQVDQSARAVNRRTFLVSGYDEADRSGISRDIGHCRDHRGNRALHIHRAASIEQIALLFGREGRAGPALARRHHIKMPGKGEMLRPFRPAPDREQIFDRAVGFLTLHETVDLEAKRLQHRFHHIKHEARGRRDRRRCNQLFRIIQRAVHRRLSGSGKGPGAKA